MILVLLIIFGLCVGSFLNVVIDRLPREESIVHGRSHCEYCGHILGWNDLIPLFSFLFLQGKCRYCHKSFGYRYPLIELTVASIFTLTYLHFFGLQLAFLSTTQVGELVLMLVMVSCLCVVFFTDLLYGIIPDEITICLFICAGIYGFVTGQDLWTSLAASIGSGLFFFLIYILTKTKGMGFGDVKYAFAMGLFLGWPYSIVGLYIAFLTGSIVSLILIVAKQKKFRGSTISFGPFLVIGTYIAWLFGANIWIFLISHFL